MLEVYAEGARAYDGGSEWCAMRAMGAGGHALHAGGVGGAGGDTLCATLYAGGVGGVGGDALCAILYAGGCGGFALFMEVLEVSEVMRCVLFCMLEAVEGTLCLWR